LFRGSLTVDGEGIDISLVDSGYLFLADTMVDPPLRKTLEILDSQGVSDVIWQTVGQLQKRYPWLNTDGLVGATLGIRNEGWFDPSSLLHGFKRKARALGVEYIEDEVIGLKRNNDRVVSVSTGKSGEVSCGAVVNAAGPRARFIAEMAGLDLPVSARKRSVFVFKCKDDVPMAPLVIDPKGMYIRREGQVFICGQQPDDGDDPESLDFDVDYPFFEERLWPQLAALVPAFESIKMVNSWAGHYAMNLADHNALLGSLPEVENLYFANGFSGHGMQQPPAIGRAISELIIHGEFRSLDLSRFLAKRLTTGELVRELYVV